MQFIIPLASRLLRFWFFLTAPAEPSQEAPLHLREVARRGRLISTIFLIIMLIVVCLALPVGIIGNHVIIWTSVMFLIVAAVALGFNRRGNTIVAGILAVASTDIALALSITTNPGGLSTNMLPLFDIMIEAELFAVSLLPPWTVFVVALLNCTFSWLDIAYQPWTPDLQHFMTTTFYEVHMRPIILHIIVALVTYLWVRSATKAIARANRAETITELQRMLSERDQSIIEEKHRLDEAIQLIVQTHAEIAKGNLSARVPIGSKSTLWGIAGALNNLLNRYQYYRQRAIELEHLQQAAYYLMQNIPNNGKSGLFPRTGTFLDQLVWRLTSFQANARSEEAQAKSPLSQHNHHYIHKVVTSSPREGGIGQL